MPILIGLLALIALVYGAVRAFDALQAEFGTSVAIGVAALVALLLVAALAYWLRRRKEVAPNIRDGDWTHRLDGSWGSVRLAAGKRLCEIRVGAEHGAYIFADVLGADLQRHEKQWQVALKVKDAARAVWLLPMQSERQGRQWQRIFMLAMQQKL